MTLRSMSLQALAITVFATVALTGAAQARNEYYEELTARVERQIPEADRSPSIDVTESALRQLVTPVIPGGLVRVIVLSETGQKKELRYYRDKQLLFVDQLDERAKPVRRDIKDDNGRLRVQIFFDYNGNRFQQRFLDPRGNLVLRKPLYVPVAAPRGPYF